MNIDSLSKQARSAQAHQFDARELRRQATEKKAAAHSLNQGANSAIKERLKELTESDEKLIEILNKEKEAKDSTQYKDTETAFADAKKELGLPELTKSKKERNKELKEQVMDEPEIASTISRAQQINEEAQTLDFQANALDPVADHAIEEIITALASEDA